MMNPALDAARAQQHRAAASAPSRRPQQTGDLQIASLRAQRHRHAPARRRRSARRGAAHAEEALAFVRKAKFGLVDDVLTPAPADPDAPGTDRRFVVVRRRRLRRGRFEQRLEGDAQPGDRSRLVLDPQAAGALLRARLRRRPRGRGEGADAAVDGAVVSRGRRVPFLRRARARGGARRRAGRAAARAPAGARRAPRGRCSCGRRLPRELRKPRRACWRPSARACAATAKTPTRLYEQAIRSARDNGFVHNEAIAYETAARFYRRRGFALIADAYLREARDRYLRWGADGKVRDIERRHPQLVEPRPPGPAATIAMPAEQLDLLSVVKASQTISGVMIREELLHTLLRLVLEEGGAPPGRWSCSRATGASTSRRRRAPGRRRRPRPAGAGARDLPDSLLAVRAAHPRTRRARRRGRRCRPVLRRRVPGARASALGAVPAHSPAGRGRRAALPRERSRPGAFTPERLLALELLAAQAAISLENALLLERERAGRAEAEAAERRAVLLGEATAVDDVDPRLRGGVRRAHPRVRALVRGLGGHRSRRGGETRAAGGAAPRSRQAAAAARAGGALPARRRVRTRRRRPCSTAASRWSSTTSATSNPARLRRRRAPRRAHRAARRRQRHRRAARRA